MSMKRQIKAVMVAGVLFVGVAIGVYAKEVTADDAVIDALNAEIAKADKGNGGDKVEKKTEDADSVEIAPVGKSSIKTGQKPKKTSSDDEEWDDGDGVPKNQNVVTVTVMGKGETPEEAKLAAFRAAVEKAVGIYVDAESMMKNSELLKDRVNTISNADIKEYETIRKGRMRKSGLYGIQIKATVEKKAIAPKFADVFPAAFADIGAEAETIHVQKVTRAKRSEDAASLMTAALEGVDRMRDWTRLSVVKGKGLEEVKKIGNQDVTEVPGKGLYSVRYSIKIDEDAYFKGFIPHFKQVLTKIQEGEAEEDVVLSSGPFDDRGRGSILAVVDDSDGRKILRTGWSYTDYGIYRSPADLVPFCGYTDMGYTYFVDPIILSGFPGVTSNESLSRRFNQQFMFVPWFGMNVPGLNVNKRRSCNIWLLDRMGKDMTLVRCSAYKLPISALRAYWKNQYGDVDSQSRIKWKSIYEKVEVALLDDEGGEIAVRIDDHVPVTLLASGPMPREVLSVLSNLNLSVLDVFNSFFIRPLFVYYFEGGRRDMFYSTEIRRDVYFPLTDAQLEKVKRVKVRFVGGRRLSQSIDSSEQQPREQQPRVRGRRPVR